MHLVEIQQKRHRDHPCIMFGFVKNTGITLFFTKGICCSILLQTCVEDGCKAQVINWLFVFSGSTAT